MDANVLLNALNTFMHMASTGTIWVLAVCATGMFLLIVARAQLK
jgi:hypothetical protein